MSLCMVTGGGEEVEEEMEIGKGGGEGETNT